MGVCGSANKKPTTHSITSSKLEEQSQKKN